MANNEQSFDDDNWAAGIDTSPEAYATPSTDVDDGDHLEVAPEPAEEDYQYSRPEEEPEFSSAAHYARHQKDDGRDEAAKKRKRNVNIIIASLVAAMFGTAGYLYFGSSPAPSQANVTFKPAGQQYTTVSHAPVAPAPLPTDPALAGMPGDPALAATPGSIPVDPALGAQGQAGVIQGQQPGDQYNANVISNAPQYTGPQAPQYTAAPTVAPTPVAATLPPAGTQALAGSPTAITPAPAAVAATGTVPGTPAAPIQTVAMPIKTVGATAVAGGTTLSPADFAAFKAILEDQTARIERLESRLADLEKRNVRPVAKPKPVAKAPATPAESASAESTTPVSAPAPKVVKKVKAVKAEAAPAVSATPNAAANEYAEKMAAQAELLAQVTQAPIAKPAKPMLAAIVPGRAFLQHNDGTRSDVAVGDSVAGCGRVTKIDADQALVVTETCSIR